MCVGPTFPKGPQGVRSKSPSKPNIRTWLDRPFVVEEQICPTSSRENALSLSFGRQCSLGYIRREKIGRESSVRQKTENSKAEGKENET